MADAILTIVEEQVMLEVAGAALLAPLVTAAALSRDRSEAAATRAESASALVNNAAVKATAAVIGGNVNEWLVTIPAGMTLADFGLIYFVVPAAPSATVWITTAAFGRQRLNLLDGNPVPPGLIITPSILTAARNIGGSQWNLTNSSDSLQEPQIHAGQVDLVVGPQSPTNWSLKSRRGYQQRPGSTFSVFAPFTNTGTVDIAIDGVSGRLRKAAGNDLSPSDIKANELVTVTWPGGDQNSFFVQSTGLKQDVPAPTVVDVGMPIPVDSPMFTQTDYPAASIVTRTGTSLKIVRPIADDLNRRLAAPNARDRCRVNATWIEWIVMHGATGSMPAPKPPLVLVDGVAVAATVSTSGTADAFTIRSIRVSLGAGAMRTVELIWPYEGPMEIIGRRASGDLVVGVSPARPTNLFVAAGDSLTQGFDMDSMANQWPHLLTSNIADSNGVGFRCINHGYGGRALVSADGAMYGAEGGTITTMFILANDVSQGTPLATVTSRLNDFFTAFFGAHPTGKNAKLLMISQPWMEAGDGLIATTIPGPQYRTTMQTAVAAAVATYPNLRYKSGRDLTDGPGTTTDSTHFKPETSRDQVYPRAKAHLQSLGWVA